MTCVVCPMPDACLAQWRDCVAATAMADAAMSDELVFRWWRQHVVCGHVEVVTFMPRPHSLMCILAPEHQDAHVLCEVKS